MKSSLFWPPHEKHASQRKKKPEHFFSGPSDGHRGTICAWKGRKEMQKKEKKEIREIVGGNLKQMQFVTWKNHCDVRI